MKKEIVIKLVKSGPIHGPFTLSDAFGNIIDEGLTRKDLIKGKTYMVDTNVTLVKLSYTGNETAPFEKLISLGEINFVDYAKLGYEESKTACLWKHLTNTQVYNKFYGTIYPYTLEYPVAYQYQDEILQSVKDFTKSYVYLSSSRGISNDNAKVETNDWFNKAVIYNGQQSSGILNLVPKPINNMKEYMSYPKFNVDSKTILFTKSDNFYQYNTFWALQKSLQVPLFITSCESMSIDKQVNQENMDYSTRSFKKAPIRAKDAKIRHTLDNRSDLHLVSQFNVQQSQKSYK